MARRKRKRAIRVSKLSRFLATVLQSAERAIPSLAERHHLSWMWAVIFGLTALAVASYIGVATVTFTGDFGVAGLPQMHLGNLHEKQVGYFGALNWSLYSVGISPVLCWAALSTWRDMPAALRGLCDHRMVRDAQFGAVDYTRLARSWKRRLRTFRGMIVLVVVIGVVFVMADWLQTVAIPLLNPHVLRGLSLDTPDTEFDWSISALYKGSHTPIPVLLVFTFLVYVGVPLVSTILTLATVVTVFVFVNFVATNFDDNSSWKIVALPREERERRCGWEVFAKFYSHLLVFAFVVLAGLWLMVTQNVYLRDFTSSEISAFIFRLDLLPHQIVLTANNLSDGLKEVLGLFFSRDGFLSPGKKVEVGAVLVGLMSYGSVAASIALLGSAARKSRKLSQEHIAAISREIHESQHTTAGRLELMEVWPVGWISELPLLTIMAFFFMSLIWYRLILIIATLIFLMRLPWMIDFIGNTFKEIFKSAFNLRKQR